MSNYSTSNQNASAEEQLRTLNAVQTYSIAGMQVKNRLDFFRLTIKSITDIFDQPKVFIFDINQKDQIVSSISFVNAKSFQEKETIGLYPKTINNLSIVELNKVPVLKSFFASLKLKNALVCEVSRADLDYAGVFVCGFSDTDSKATLIQDYQLNAFKLLVQKAGLINYLLRQNERLKLELEERKKIEQIIAEQAVELKRSNEDLEQFAYVISHDLKAPLRNITSFSQLLKRNFSKEIDDEAKEYLGFILTGVKQFGALIDDLLLYSRAVKRAIEFEESEFELVVEAAKYNLRVRIEETQAEVNYENLPELNVNFSQMTQVFQNLISNAIKFRQKDVIPVITITANNDDSEYILFEVSDNGIGIEKEYFERIFSLFQRLHTQSEYEGTGLGLSICKKIIERHKGSISVKSQGLNKGTTFYFTIPKHLST